MANKRMFNIKIVDSDAFLDMPLSTQALYFHLNMRADDDGFIGNPKRIQRLIGCSDDDLKLLLAKRFILAFEDGVIVIKHWRLHNTIRKERYTPTVYTDEKERLIIKENKSYSLNDGKTLNVIPNVIPIGGQMSPTDIDIDLDKGLDTDLGLDKDLDKDDAKASKPDLETEFERLWSIYPNKKGKPNAFKDYVKARTRKKNPVSYEDVEKGLNAYIFYIRETKTDMQYVKHGSTWFHQECWGDDYTVVKKADEVKTNNSFIKMLQEMEKEDGY